MKCLVRQSAFSTRCTPPSAACLSATDNAGPSTALVSATDCDSLLGSSTNNAGPSTVLASATDFDGFTPAGVDDLYTAWAANRQPAPAGCGGVAYRKLAGVDDLYTARAANRLGPAAGGGAQEARWRGRSLHCTGCQPAAGSGRLLGGWRTGSSLARTTSIISLHPATPRGGDQAVMPTPRGRRRPPSLQGGLIYGIR